MTIYEFRQLDEMEQIEVIWELQKQAKEKTGNIQ